MHFIEALRCVMLGFLLMMLGLTPGRIQVLTDGLYEIAARLNLWLLLPLRPVRIQSEPCWWLFALGAVYVVATLVSFFGL
jgi:hypothetical protein